MLQQQANRNMESSRIKSTSDSKEFLIFIPPIHPTAQQSCRDFVLFSLFQWPQHTSGVFLRQRSLAFLLHSMVESCGSLETKGLSLRAE